MEFIDRIDRLRKEKGVTTKQMLDDCHLNRNAMQDWKRGSVPRFATLKVLADYFNVPVSLLDDTFDGGYGEEDIISSPDAYLLSSDEKFIVDTYRSASDTDKLKIMRIFMNMKKPES